MKKESQNILNVKSVLASIFLLAIILGAAYSYYTAASRIKKYKLSIQDSDLTLAYETTANVSASFDATDLTKETSETESGYYGYLEDGNVTSTISLTTGDSNNYDTCKYELWYEPTDVWESTSTTKSMVLIGTSEGTNSSDTAGFEFDLANVSTKTKITDGYINAKTGSQNWNFLLRLYNNTVAEESFDNKVTGIVSVKVVSCEVSKLTAESHEVTVKEGSSVDINITADNLDSIVVSSSDSNIATATYANGKVTINRLSGGEAVIYISDGSTGYDSIKVISDVNIDIDNIMLANRSTIYTKSMTCDNNGSLTYDATNGEYVIDLADRTSYSTSTNCSIEYTKPGKSVKKYLSDVVVNLATTTAANTDWKVTKDNGYYYQGEKPDNYIMFNGELWRIIGVFDSNIHGQTDKQLVKIIRNDLLDGYVYEARGIANVKYGDSYLYSILNNYYYNATDGSSAGVCFGGLQGTLIPKACDFTLTGIQNNTTRDLIQTVDVYQETATNGSYYSNANDYASNSMVTEANVTLMTFDDYDKTSIVANACNQGITDACAESNWLLTGETETTITLFSKLFHMRPVGNTDSFLYITNYESSALRPAVFLKEDVYVVSGNGSKTNPYVIAR